MLTTRSWRLVAGTAVAVAIAGSAFAQGQPQNGDRQPGQRMRDRGPGGGGFGGIMRAAAEKPAFTQRDLEPALKPLSLTAEQQDAVKSLVEGYQNQAEKIAEEVRKGRQGAMDTMREEGPEAAQSAWKKVAENQKKLRADRDQLDAGLLSDIQALLTKDQAGAWDSARRQIVRGQSLRQGLLSGERVDVSVLVRQLELSDKDREPIKPVLEQYELDVEREIAARDKVTSDAVNSFDPSQMFDPEKRGELTKRMEARREASEKLRDVNNRFAKQIETLLPEGPKAQFDKSFHEASFPEVYRQTQAGRSLAAAEGFDDLSSDQRLAVADLRDKYDAQMTVLHPKMEAATLEMEKNFSIANALSGFARGQGRGNGNGDGGQRGDQVDPQRTLRQERREVDDKALADLKKILSEDQAARLPEPDQQDQGLRRRGGGGGGGGNRANSPDGA